MLFDLRTLLQRFTRELLSVHATSSSVAQAPLISVDGGPFDGRQVRELVTIADGWWVTDRLWLCRPVARRPRTPTCYPYQLVNGRYVWRGDDVNREELTP